MSQKARSNPAKIAIGCQRLPDYKITPKTRRVNQSEQF
jgi:hypothetical protein